MNALRLVVALTLLFVVVLLIGCANTPAGEITNDPTTVPQPQAQTQEPEQKQTVLDVDLYILDNEFSPPVIMAREGQLVRITVANGRMVEQREAYDSQSGEGYDKNEVPFDLSIPAFGVQTEAYIADEIAFTADKTGTYEFYCIDCSPQIVGTIVVS